MAWLSYTSNSITGRLMTWCSGESTRLPPMWPGFYSQTRHYMWVSLLVLYSASRAFLWVLQFFPLLKKPNIWLDFSLLQCSSARTTRHWNKFLSFPFLTWDKNRPSAMDSGFPSWILLHCLLEPLSHWGCLPFCRRQKETAATLNCVLRLQQVIRLLIP